MLKISTQIFLLLAFGSSWAIYRETGSVWPKPQSQVTLGTFAVLSDNLTVTGNLVGCAVLDQAIQRYKDSIYRQGCAPLGGKPFGYHNRRKPRKDSNEIKDYDNLTEINILVKSPCEEWPVSGSEETYVLQAHTAALFGKVQIYAYSVWAAIRSLETFSQLVHEIKIGDEQLLVINTTYIIDYPRFTYRGLMLDTARHFLPVSVILENLEAMSQNKMNVFHWHIVDDQSFPFQSKLFPDLSNLGAYDPVTHVYSPKDVAQVIEFARVRGIRVIPEFDTPGHSQSWGKGVPDLLTPCYNGPIKDGTFGPVDPILNTTYTFLQQFLGEVAQVFPDSYMHLGGDEVDFSCWKSNPDILDFMKAQGFGSDFTKLEEYYIQKVVNIVNQDLKKTTLVWQEVFDDGKVELDKNTIVHIWKDGYQNELTAVTKAGFTTILSSCWYLNYISYGIDWTKYYHCDPWDFLGNREQKSLVIGGVAAMWGEYQDGAGVTSSIWARACAVAERLWSEASVSDLTEAAPRIEEQRCRMLKRGIRVNTINGPGYCPCDAYF